MVVNYIRESAMQINVKNLTIGDANRYLSSVGMEIGGWDRIKLSNENNKIEKINYPAPENALELLSFANHVSTWLPKGDWKLFQIDNSGSLNAYQSHLFNKLLFGKDEIINFDEMRTFLFEFGANKEVNICTELLITNAIYFFLLFKSHGQVVSSIYSPRKILSINDGYIYFISDEVGQLEAKVILEKFESNPLLYPDWVGEINSEYQERNFKQI